MRYGIQSHLLTLTHIHLFCVTAKIIGAPLPSILDLFLARCSSKSTSIVKDPTHPSHSLFQLLPSGRRTGASETAPPDCSTAFSPRLWEPWTQLIPPLSETPHKPLPPETWTITPPNLTTSHKTFFVQFEVLYTQVSGPVQTTWSNTLSSIRTRHFHTLLYVHNPTKDSIIYACLHAHALQITLNCSPASCLTYDVSLCTCTVFIWSIRTVCIF